MDKLHKALPPRTRRVVIGIVGGIVVVAGIIMIPYPGPGWLVVFAGLAILAQEFPWAERLLGYARGKYDAWTEWVKRQSVFIRGLILAFTCLVVIVTIWLVNGYGLINDWFHLGQGWLHSPFFR